MDGCKDDWMDGLMVDCVDGWIYGRMVVRVHEWMDREMGGWMGRVGMWVNGWMCIFA